MFNVSLKLRDAEGFTTPKGPSFSSARTINSEIDGTSITFKAPKHKPRRSNHEGYAPQKSYSESQLRFRNYYDDEKAARGLPDHWREADFFTTLGRFIALGLAEQWRNLGFSSELLRLSIILKVFLCFILGHLNK